MFETREKREEIILGFWYEWELELIAALYLLFISLYFIWLEYLVVFYVFMGYLYWFLMSMFFPPKQRGKIYYHHKKHRDIEIRKSWWIFSYGSYPQIWEGMRVGTINDFYFNRNLREVRSSKPKILSGEEFEEIKKGGGFA